MAINVITGQPRNGKSQRAIALMMDKLIKDNDKLEKQGKARKIIYSDIDGINNLTTPTKLPDVITEFEQEKIWFGEHDDPNKPDGYWCPPYGSIFFFDECHKRGWVVESSGTVSKNPTTVSLNEHGHAGHDMYLLTQFPNYIHTHIRGLVQEHWHVKRIAGLRQAWVYKWDEFIINPRAKTNIDNAYAKERFKFKKRYEQAYKSASAHAKISFKFPMKMLWVIIPLIIIIILFFRSFGNSMFARHLSDSDQPEQAQDDQTQQQIDQLQRHTVDQNQQIEDLQTQIEQLRKQYLPQHIEQLAEHEDIRPAMIVSSSSGGCRAYNSYGEMLLINTSLCNQMNDYPSLIPRTRTASAQQQPVQQQQSQVPSASAPNEPPATDVKYFDHTKDFNS